MTTARSEARHKVIIDSISEEISDCMRRLRSEQEAPRLAADESDDLIKQLKNRVIRLRGLRCDVEDSFTEALL